MGNLEVFRKPVTGWQLIVATGACGIHCDCCNLRLREIGSSCGPGTSGEAEKKIQVQKKLFGQPCPILACTRMNQIQCCLRDCRIFPCENFRGGPYPFSEGFLKMQERRRQERPGSQTATGDTVKVPPGYWEDLKSKDLYEISKKTKAVLHPPEGLVLRVLENEILIHTESRKILRRCQGQWEETNAPLLELLSLVYLLNASADPLCHEMVSAQELKGSHFFQGPHALKTAPVLQRYGKDIEGLKKVAQSLGGEPMGLADTAYRFLPFPKVPLYYLLWQGDEEFEPRLSVLFDRSIEKHLSPDAIWGVVNLVSTELLTRG